MFQQNNITISHMKIFILTAAFLRILHRCVASVLYLEIFQTHEDKKKMALEIYMYVSARTQEYI